MIEVKHWENGNIESVGLRNKEGEWHNPNGPALQTYYKNGQESYKAYYVDGKLHNPNGPAQQHWYADGKEESRAYWVEGSRLTKEEFQKLQNTVEIVCEGNSVRISRESAKALNLIKE